MRQGTAVVASLVTILLLVPVMMAAAAQEPAFVEAMNQAEALMEQGDYQAAITSLKEAERLSAQPQDRQRHRREGGQAPLQGSR